MKVVWCPSDCAEPGGTDSVSIQHWLLGFGEASGELWIIVLGFMKWIANENPPWATFRVLIYVHIVGLDKHLEI